ncbi:MULTISPECIES: PDR/VanB family oxidoreductase [unclassified Aureimonas]|uniref:PDR/VanB family oxidoreductase n=1 Tax=unclassified Aureimonas TaxID=2615206 RepID=UPI0006FB26BE|nr:MULTISPECIES: PDR/VanB family oxidoreductase [unclassified Aureimonas]KQT64000.1 ferredoxin-NADP reductase [Aureimonas sp. Leaf427]KQT81193.1 ferredoxin-NADP reductase [Aureimonas sp. Leaf460]
MSGGVEYKVRVVEAEPVSSSVRRLRMERISGGDLPPYSAGSHTVVTLETGERRVKNAYSLLAGTLAGGAAYEIAVQRSLHSRGGSAFIHDRVAVGTELTLSAPVNLFPVNRTAKRHVLVAGGIGITPIAAMAEELAAAAAPYEIHYAMRDEASGAFAEALAARHGKRLRLYVSARRERLAVRDVLLHQPLGTHLYVCGPERMIEGMLGDAREAGWPERALHAERFLAPEGGDPFALRLQRSGLSLTVGAHQTLLEAIEEAGVDAPYLCRGGACGQCATAVLAADGTLLHADHYLSDAEKAAGTTIMTCVSRLSGRELVLDL